MPITHYRIRTVTARLGEERSSRHGAGGLGTAGGFLFGRVVDDTVNDVGRLLRSDRRQAHQAWL